MDREDYMSPKRYENKSFEQEERKDPLISTKSSKNTGTMDSRGAFKKAGVKSKLSKPDTTNNT